MNRSAQGVVLLLLGGALLRATLGSDQVYLRYVKQSLHPYLIGAGVVLCVAAVMTIIYEIRRVHQEDHDHVHDHEPKVGWMLLAPVLGILLVTPPALGAFAAGQSGSARLRDTIAYAPLPSGDPAQITLLDYATRAVYDKGQTMRGRTVKLSGFLSGGPGGRQVLTRIVLSCCAADGVPVKIGMEGDVPDGVADDQWVEVIGRYSATVEKDPINDSDIPHIEVIEWRRIEPPRNQYE